MACRPGNDDTEEDLLEAQNEFLAGRLRPAAAAVRVKKEGANEEEKSTSGRDVVRLDGWFSFYSLTLSLPSSKSTFSQPCKEQCINEVVRTELNWTDVLLVYHTSHWVDGSEEKKNNNKDGESKICRGTELPRITRGLNEAR